MAKDTALEYLESQLSERDETFDTFSSGSGTPPFRRPYGVDYGLHAQYGAAPPPGGTPAASSSIAASNGFSFFGMQQGLRKPDLSVLVGQLNNELKQGNVPRSPRAAPRAASPPGSPPVPFFLPLAPPPQLTAYPPPQQATREGPPTGAPGSWENPIPMNASPGRPMVVAPPIAPPTAPRPDEGNVAPADVVASQMASLLREREEADARSIIEPARSSMPPRVGPAAPVPSWLPPPVEGFAWPKPPSSPGPPMGPRGSLVLLPPGSPRAMSPPKFHAPLSPGGSFVAPLPGSPDGRLPMPMPPGGPLSPGGSLKVPLAPPPSMPLSQVAAMKARMPSGSLIPQQAPALSFGRSTSSPIATPRDTPREPFPRRRSIPESPLVVTNQAPLSPLPCWSKAPPMRPSAKPPGAGTWKPPMANRGHITPMPGFPFATPPGSRRQMTPAMGPSTPRATAGMTTPMPSSPRQASNKSGPARRNSNSCAFQSIQAPRSVAVLGPADQTGRASSPGLQDSRAMFTPKPGTEVWNSMSTPR